MAAIHREVTFEVSGHKNDGRTLMQEINEGKIAKPPLMGFNEWQAWRRDFGKRPVRRTDGGKTPVRFETNLWKSTMENLYGEDWQADLNQANEEAEESAQEAGASSAAAVSSGVAAAPHAPPPVQTPPVTARETQGNPAPQEASPGSGEGLTRPASVGSWHSDNPGTPATLRTKLFKDFNPSRELMEEYVNRIERQANALETITGTPVGKEQLDIFQHAQRYVRICTLKAL